MLYHIRKWFSPPVFEGDDEKTRVADLLSTVVVIFLIGSLAYGFLSPIEPEAIPLRVMIVSPFIFLMLGLKEMVNRGYTNHAGLIIVGSLWLLFSSSMIFGSTLNNPALMGYTLVVVCAGLFLGWKSAIGWGLFSIATSGVILFLESVELINHQNFQVSPLSFWAAEILYIIVITILLSRTTRYIADSTTRARHELSEKIRVQDEREKVIHELEIKNAELERFTYTVSHDLKSPLVTISGFIGLLQKDASIGDLDHFKRDIFKISEATDKMHRLLNELLELSRVGRLMNPPVQTSLREIIEEAATLTRGRLMSGSIRLDVQDDLPQVNGDRPRLVEVFQNLIDNAAKFMGDQPEPQIHIGADTSNEGVLCFVKDNGIGIESNFHEKIFGLFDKLDPASEGTGVGLSLVKRIIEVHGGRIWVESKGPGYGSVFKFILPNQKLL